MLMLRRIVARTGQPIITLAAPRKLASNRYVVCKALQVVETCDCSISHTTLIVRRIYA